MRRLEQHIEPEPNSGCWIWLAARTRGYGVVRVSGRLLYAHRLLYELIVRQIAPGLTLDHRCRVTCCVNPHHLEPVSIAENLRRQAVALRKNSCRHGHAYTPENTMAAQSGYRQCRECHRLK